MTSNSNIFKSNPEESLTTFLSQEGQTTIIVIQVFFYKIVVVVFSSLRDKPKDKPKKGSTAYTT